MAHLSRLGSAMPTAAERAQGAELVARREIPGKGMGLVALKRILPWTPLAVYPGTVYTYAAWERLKGPRPYAIDTMRLRSDGTLDEDLVVDPALPGDGATLQPRFADLAGPYVNEPGQGQDVNAVWVNDIPGGKLWLYSFKTTPAGAEITACYGDSYAPLRKYRPSCSRAGSIPGKRLPGESKLRQLPGNEGYVILFPDMRLPPGSAGPATYPLDQVHPRRWYTPPEQLTQLFLARARGGGEQRPKRPDPRPKASARKGARPTVSRAAAEAAAAEAAVVGDLTQASAGLLLLRRGRWLQPPAITRPAGL